MSYQPLPANARTPLPPSLRMTRESHIADKTTAAPTRTSSSASGVVQGDKPLQTTDPVRPKYDPSSEDDGSQNNVQSADVDETSEQKRQRVDEQPDPPLPSQTTQTMTIPVQDHEYDDAYSQDEPSTLRFQSPSTKQTGQPQPADLGKTGDHNASVAAEHHDVHEPLLSKKSAEDGGADREFSSQLPKSPADRSPSVDDDDREALNRRQGADRRSKQFSDSDDDRSPHENSSDERKKDEQQKDEETTESESEDSDNDFLTTTGEEASSYQPTDSEDRVNLFK